jgi:small GTP-binding protein
MQKISPLKKKICLLGSFAVGKTSLIERFVHNRFDEKYLTTIGVKVSQKILPPLEHPVKGQLVQYTFLIWDIARMEKLDNVVTNYYRGAAGALAVADLTRDETIPHLGDICTAFRSVNPRAELLILGNKLDIFQHEKKTNALLKTTASGFSTEYLLTSAKTGERVEEAFLMLARKIGMGTDG